MVLIVKFFYFHQEYSQILQQAAQGGYAVFIMDHFQDPAR